MSGKMRRLAMRMWSSGGRFMKCGIGFGRVLGGVAVSSC